MPSLWCDGGLLNIARDASHLCSELGDVNCVSVEWQLMGVGATHVMTWPVLCWPMCTHPDQQWPVPPMAATVCSGDIRSCWPHTHQHNYRLRQIQNKWSTLNLSIKEQYQQSLWGFSCPLLYNFSRLPKESFQLLCRVPFINGHSFVIVSFNKARDETNICFVVVCVGDIDSLDNVDPPPTFRITHYDIAISSW